MMKSQNKETHPNSISLSLSLHRFDFTSCLSKATLHGSTILECQSIILFFTVHRKE